MSMICYIISLKYEKISIQLQKGLFLILDRSIEKKKQRLKTAVYSTLRVNVCTLSKFII